VEPLGLIVFSTFMFTVTFQLITQSAQVLASGHADINLSKSTIIIICTVIVAKTILFLYCWLQRGVSLSVDALAQDHRNDIMTNSFGVATAILGYYYLWWIDSLGAIVIGSYIMVNWFRTGFGYFSSLSGKSSTPGFLQQLTYLAWNHDSRILEIDTVRAFHFGLGFLVEVDIVLPETMSLNEAHDIGEGLQLKLEKLETVERAFVHLDYETSHRPDYEHKIT